jgi:hypothetical protein
VILSKAVGPAQSPWPDTPANPENIIKKDNTMALSDTCFETLRRLTADFHRYIDWEYSTENMSKLVSTILELAELAYNLNHEPELAEAFVKIYGAPKPPKLIAECVVIGNLIADPSTSTFYEDGVATVASIASVNPRIRDAIINAYNWQQSPAGIAERFRSSDVVNVEPVYRRIADL